MTLSTPHQEPLTPSTDTTGQTTQPDVSATKPYSEIAAELPSPADVISDASVPEHGPELQHELTIPGNHTDPGNIPYNSSELSWRSWRSKFSTIASLYVLAARHNAAAGSQRRAVHAVFSPPQTDVQSRSALRHWRARASEVAQEVGIRGGMSSFHGYRVKPEPIEEFQSHIYNTEYADTATDVLLWEWLRRGNWREYVQWGPHIHIVGVCDSMDDYHGEGLIHHLRTFPDYDRSVNMGAVAEHRAVAKDIVDHITFDPRNPYPPMSWFGELEGSSWSSAQQLTTDATLDKIRDRLINGPANVESTTK